MKKSDLMNLRRYAGDLSGLYGMQDITYNEGRARGMRAVLVNNGAGLTATVLPDRCLDIPYCTYKGVNVGLVTKVGLSSPAFYTPDGVEGFLRQFNGGLLTTAGLISSGVPSTVDGRNYGLHGNAGNLPAYNVNKEEVLDGDDIVLKLTGDIREARVFAEHVVLHRTLLFDTARCVIHIDDVIENRGFSPAPLMNLYHINFGYPLLDAGCKLYFSTREVTSRDDCAAGGISRYHLTEDPDVVRPEQCYLHTGGSGPQFAMLHNEKLGLAAVVHYDTGELPYLCQWKSMSAGDYALGLEPCSVGFYGLAEAMERNVVRYLAAGETICYRADVEFTDDAGAIAEYRAKCKEGK